MEAIALTRLGFDGAATAATPREADAEHLFRLKNNVDEFDILGLLNLFRDRTYGMKHELATDYRHHSPSITRAPVPTEGSLLGSRS